MFGRACLIAAAVGIGGISVAAGKPAITISFPDGNVLSVLGSAGSGSNTAFLAVDFSNNTPSGPSFAWQYNWNGSASEYDMVTAVEADSALTVAPVLTGTSDFVDNFNYGLLLGSTDSTGDPYSYWGSWIGQNDTTDSSYSATQNMNWVFAPLGVDDLNLGDFYDNNGDLLSSGNEGLVYGWTVTTEADDDNGDDPVPILPETSVPEPTGALLITAGLLTLRRARGLSCAQ
jgi:hypothetical protein